MRPTSLVLALVLPLTSLQAQATPDSGARFRVTFTEAGASRRVTGTLVSLNADSIVLGDERESSASGPLESRLAIPRAGITSLQVNTGRHSSAGTGALIGAGIGVVGGLVLGVAAQCDGSEVWFAACVDGAGQTAVLGLFLGAVGAGIGAITGAFITHDTWHTLQQPPAVGVILRPAGDGVAAGLSINF